MKPLSHLAAAATLVCAGSCGGSVEPVEPPAAPPSPPPLATYDADWVGFDVPGDDICKKNPDGSLEFPVEPGTYQGILRNARCRQQKFLTMAWLSDTLGVECGHCHVKDPANPKKHVFETWTPEKRAANWMYRSFVQGLRAVDGSPVACATCHTDRRTGKPVMTILGTPRDEQFASEWMHSVMVSEFVERDGDRMRCSTCHAGMAPGTPDWKPDVILEVVHDGGEFSRQHVAIDPAEATPDEPPTSEAPEEGGGAPSDGGGGGPSEVDAD